MPAKAGIHLIEKKMYPAYGAGRKQIDGSSMYISSQGLSASRPWIPGSRQRFALSHPGMTRLNWVWTLDGMVSNVALWLGVVSSIFVRRRMMRLIAVMA
jgi:hypothetical protein